MNGDAESIDDSSSAASSMSAVSQASVGMESTANADESDDPHTEFLAYFRSQAATEPYASQLADYSSHLLARSRTINLTGAKTVAAVLPHVMDALTVAPYVCGTLVDIGSGGGLPAIPLAIVTGAPIVLVEATAKKTAFLRDTVKALNISATVLTGRAETVAYDEAYRERYQTATARAVAVAPAVLEYCMPFLAIGGRVILQRGRTDDRERAATTDAALVLGGVLVEEVPLEGERRLFIVEKRAKTPWRFPRRNGIAIKRPLCM